MAARAKLGFYDFFAGAGLATLGLRASWQCLWANDISPSKAAIYRANFGSGHFQLGDVAQIPAADLPRPAGMAWASFPCQDLSLAGWRKGLAAPRSGAFWAFWRILRDLAALGDRPGLVVLENVPGLLYGDGFPGLCEAMAALDLQFGALVMDARRFLPQSRPRVFLIAIDRRADVSSFRLDAPSAAWSTPALIAAHARLPKPMQALWRWWRLPEPRDAVPSIAAIIEENPTGVESHTPEHTAALLELMNPANRAKVSAALRDGRGHIGFLYRRMRVDGQRAEVRFDGLSGCLRTPRGGSSRQTVVIVEAGRVRSRLLSAREAARLMGVPDSFWLPPHYSDAYHAMGDGVAVPVVEWLSERLLRPLAESLPSAAPAPALTPYAALSEKRASAWMASRQP
jgi:DNA (cytosine-5)-methyltransferase 1